MNTDRKGLLIFLSGLAVQVAVFVIRMEVRREPLTYEGSVLPKLVKPLIFVAAVLFCIGLAQFARSKGRSVLYGLLGLIWPIGIIVIACLPSKITSENEA